MFILGWKCFIFLIPLLGTHGGGGMAQFTILFCVTVLMWQKFILKLKVYNGLKIELSVICDELTDNHAMVGKCY